eukprot:jgi/Ulvmu1/9819/UM056_0060.1
MAHAQPRIPTHPILGECICIYSALIVRIVLPQYPRFISLFNLAPVSISMASLLNADLPSEDEMDEDFDPDAEDANKPAKKAKTAAAGVSRRGLAGAGAPSKQHDAMEDVNRAADNKRWANAASMFAQLKSTSDQRQAHGAKTAAAKAPVAPRAPAATPMPQVQIQATAKRPLHDPDAYWMQALGMAPPQKKLQASSELVNRILRNATDGSSPPTTSATPAPAAQLPSLARQYAPQAEPAAASGQAETAAAADAAATGSGPPKTDAASAAEPALAAPGTTAAQAPAAAADVPGGAEDIPGGAEDADAAEAAAAAAAALRALDSGQHHADAAKRADLVRVVEKRNFAGREVEMEREVVAGSKAAQLAQDRAAAASNKSGLDAALANMTGPKKANLIDKSADDWKGFKDSNAELKDELNLHGKSSDKYLEKQAFLKKAELTVYEKQRDARLQSDMRTRGRL